MQPEPTAVPESPPRQRIRFLELDSLRGVATLFIVGAHVDLGPLFWAWSLMDMFFVLSSFLLTRIVIKQCTDVHGVIAFYGRRIERIWPLYFLTVTVLFGVAIATNVHHHAAVVDLTVFARLYSFSQYSEMLFQPFTGYQYIGYARHLWSLAVEEQFYVLLPLTIVLLRRTPPVVWITVLILVAMTSTAMRAANPNIYILSSHADAFALGSLLALTFDHISAYWRMANRAAWIMAAAGLLFFLPYLGAGYANWWAGGVVLGYQAGAAVASTIFWLAVIFLLAQHRGAPALAFMRTPFLVHLGRLSYALYLIHYPMLRLLPAPLSRAMPGLSKTAVLLICLTLIWLLAELLYRLIDRPLQERRPTNLRGGERMENQGISSSTSVPLSAA
jgi:peptidoglycan/LPS O-acetylase OafA/YrhL